MRLKRCEDFLAQDEIHRELLRLLTYFFTLTTDSSPLSRSILKITVLLVTCLCQNIQPSQWQMLWGKTPAFLFVSLFLSFCLENDAHINSCRETC